MRIAFGNKLDWEHAIRLHAGDADQIDFRIFEDLSGHDWNAYDVVVPLRLEEYRVLREAGEYLAGKVLYPTEAAVDFCDDKDAFGRALSRSPFHAMVPRVIEENDTVVFPCILKKRRDEWGVNSVIIHSDDGLSRCDPQMRSGDYFLQEYIAGHEEWATHILMRDGRIVFSFTVVYDVADHPFVKGKWQGTRTMTTGAACRHLSEFLDLLNFIGFRDGTCCFDYKIVDGIPKIFEINPRFGASLVHDVANYLRSYKDAAQGWSPPAWPGGQGSVGPA